MKLLLLLVLASACVQLTVSYVRPLSASSFQHVPTQLIDYKLALEGRSSFFDQVRGFIEGIIQDATNFINEYAKKPTEIVAQIQKEVKGLADVNQASAADMKKEVTDLMDAWNTTGANALNCTKEYAPLMTEVLRKFNASISDCIQNATASAKEIETIIGPNIIQVAKYRMELETLISDCFQKTSNIFQAISCAFVNAYEIKTKIVETVMEIKTIIVTSTTEGLKIVANAKRCISSVVDVYQKDMRDIKQQYKNCILLASNFHTATHLVPNYYSKHKISMT